MSTIPAAIETPSRHSATWTLLSNRGHVLICIAHDPDVRMRDVALRVGITERAAFGLVVDLVDGGFIGRTRVGRRNRYTVNSEVLQDDAADASGSVGDLLTALGVRPR
ncbi:MAG: hypothetical protein JWL72_2177 [Ilumatobacteraceae bacterium]|nr:hypothetical protein [Ilumatobacteraceae bacterium]MCU1388839.1 hypothetical protein [Ilumatobacteraceae bacterium]